MNKEGNIHIFVGEDDYLTDVAAKKILFGFVPEELRASALEIVDGRAGNEEAQLASISSCRGSVASPPFLDPVKATWWRGVDFLPGGGKGGKITDDVKTALERFASSLADQPLPENQILVITASKLLPSSIVAKTLAGCATVARFASEAKAGQRAEAALVALPELAEEEHLKFAPGADAAFIAKAGTDTRTLVSELAKMRAYLGTERDVVTAEDVATITSASGDEPEFWDFIDAMDRRDPALFMKLYTRFADAKIAIPVLNTLEKHVRELIVLLDAYEHGWLTIYGWKQGLPEDVTKQLDATGFGPSAMRQAWLLKKRIPAARAYSMRELRNARARIVRTRAAVVSGADDMLFLSELLRIIRKPAK